MSPVSLAMQRLSHATLSPARLARIVYIISLMRTSRPTYDITPTSKRRLGRILWTTKHEHCFEKPSKRISDTFKYSKRVNEMLRDGALSYLICPGSSCGS